MSNILFRKNVLLDYFFVFTIVIYAGSATTFVRSVSTWENPIGVLFPIVISLIVAFYHRVRLSQTFIYLIIGFLFYNLALTLKFSAVHPRFMGIYLINFLLAYIAYSAYRYRFFFYFENVVYYLSIIGLVLWGVQMAAPDLLKSSLGTLAFSQPGSGNVAINVIVYTIPNLVGFESLEMNFGGVTVIRNAGFAWEAGAFACYINLAIFINFIRTKFKLQNNRKFWVLTLALISTFSTTGFSIFLVLFIFYIYNQHIRYMLLFAPLSIALAVLIYTLPFMSDKIIDMNTYDTDAMIENSIAYSTNVTPQRFESLQIDFVDFLNNPILGYGGHQTEMWTAKLGANVSTISGIGKVIAVFGIVGILFFFISLTFTSMEFARIFRYKGWFFQFLMILMISISYSIIFTPLLMCFWLTNSAYLTNKGKLRFLFDRLKLSRLKFRTTMS